MTATNLFAQTLKIGVLRRGKLELLLPMCGGVLYGVLNL